MPLQGSSRWCPTPEQLMILEEIYKGGIRTPNASQIQQITAHLSLYGKIEGKNVFYWFQNHKARDRQKLRKKQLFLAKQLQQQRQQQQQQQQQQNYHHHDCSPPALHHPLNFHYNSLAFLHQGGQVEDAYSSQLKQHTWKPDLQVETCIDKTIKRMYDQDHWMTTMMMDVGTTSSPPPCCSRGPPKTLQLFPTTTTSTDPSS